MSKITIIGLGLIGGSIGLALRQANNSNLQVMGYDDDVGVGKKAERRGAVEKAAWSLPDAIEGASMVIIATPVMAIREVLETIADMVPPGCVVTDTGSTKAAVLDWADEYLPEGVSFVGGHPMAGREMSGIDSADPGLFRGARYVIIPSKTAREEAVESVVELAGTLGARPYYVDAYEHDSYVAAVSHLPFILSSALVSATSKSPGWREMSKLAATGFRDATRLASGDPVMNLDICLTNREVIIHWINEAIRELQNFREMVSATEEEAGIEPLGQAFANAWAIREQWLVRFESGQDDDQPPSSNLPRIGDQMGDFFFGGLLRDRYQRLLSLQERKAQDQRQRRWRRS